MAASAAGQTLRVIDAEPFGDVTIAPSGFSGRSEVELAREMATELMTSSPESDADALRHLRQTFPDSPLTVRVAALAAIMRR
jgi:hypothetical protein